MLAHSTVSRSTVSEGAELRHRSLDLVEGQEGPSMSRVSLRSTIHGPSDYGQLDCRGVLRGSCLLCDCDEYDGGSTQMKCVICHHPPGQHMRPATPICTTDSDTMLEMATPRLLENLTIASTADFDDTLCEVDELLQPEERCIYKNCSRQKYKDGDKTHDFCGKNHARLHKELMSQNPDMICKTPGCKNVKYKRENGECFDYCSLYCRNNQQKKGHAMLDPSMCGVCSLPGCGAFRYQDPSNGRIHEFCSRTHASEASQAGIPVVEVAQVVPTITISLVSSQMQAAITKKFTEKWAQGKGKCPTIDFIFSVSNLKLKQIWDTYGQSLSITTIEEYFHGTRLECDITNANTLCSDEDCGVCGIANIGFDRRCIRKNINFQRFGHGFYLAPNSSKCHDYTRGKNGYRAMLLFDVYPGKKYQLQKDDQALTAPPEGCNSVHGKAGIHLNYDELVIYNPDSALPKYIIIYQRDGEKKIAK